MNKEKVADLIKSYEYYKNGLNKLSGGGVNIKNLQVNGNIAICDITLFNDADGTSTEYKNIEYDLKKLE